MPVLHLGVIDLPYVKKQGSGKKHASHVTTGDVAEFLEDEYHVMETFVNEQEGSVASLLEKSVQGTIENMLMGGPSNQDPFGEGTSKIEEAFKEFIDTKQMDKLGIPGVPTQASLDGVSHRFKGKKSGTARPSFQDTGLYEDSFRAWVD